MEIKVFDTRGKMIAERHFFPGRRRSESSYLISEAEPGVFIVSIMMDDIVKIKKL